MIKQRFILILFAILALSACRTVYVPQEHTVYRDRYHHSKQIDTLIQADTVRIIDSVIVHARGDSTLIERYRHELHKLRERSRQNRVDTVYKTDIEVRREAVQVPTRYVPWWAKFLGGAGLGALLVALYLVLRERIRSIFLTSRKRS